MGAARATAPAVPPKIAVSKFVLLQAVSAVPFHQFSVLVSQVPAPPRLAPEAELPTGLPSASQYKVAPRAALTMAAERASTEENRARETLNGRGWRRAR